MLWNVVRRGAGLALAVLSVEPTTAVAAELTHAAATGPEPQRDRLDERLSLYLARLSLSGSYFRGAMLVGHGSIQHYQGVGSTVDLDVVRFFHPRIGFELALRASPNLLALGAAGDGYGGVSGAFDLAPIASPGRSVIVGIGAGFDGGSRYWFSELRAYPLALLRARWLPTRDLGLHLAYELMPVATGVHSVIQNRLEVGVGWHLFHTGVRGAVLRVQGGEPERTLGEVEVGMFMGIGVFQ